MTSWRSWLGARAPWSTGGALALALGCGVLLSVDVFRGREIATAVAAGVAIVLAWPRPLPEGPALLDRMLARGLVLHVLALLLLLALAVPAVALVLDGSGGRVVGVVGLIAIAVAVAAFTRSVVRWQRNTGRVRAAVEDGLAVGVGVGSGVMTLELEDGTEALLSGTGSERRALESWIRSQCPALGSLRPRTTMEP